MQKSKEHVPLMPVIIERIIERMVQDQGNVLSFKEIHILQQPIRLHGESFYKYVSDFLGR